MSLVFVVLANCVGENPHWDPPVIASDGPDDADEDGARGGDDEGDGSDASESNGESEGVAGDDGVTDEGDGSTSADDDDSGDAGGSDGSTSTAVDEGPPTDDGDPVCPGTEMLCGGECTDIETDKHACGIDCIDCTLLYDDARCRDGECESKDDD